MVRKTCELTLEVSERTSLIVDGCYLYYPAEPMVRYYPDGSGYPGSDADVDLVSCVVVAWIVAGEERKRDVHPWLWQSLDAFALMHVEENWDKVRRTLLRDAQEQERTEYED